MAAAGERERAAAAHAAAGEAQREAAQRGEALAASMGRVEALLVQQDAAAAELAAAKADRARLQASVSGARAGLRRRQLGRMAGAT